MKQRDPLNPAWEPIMQGGGHDAEAFEITNDEVYQDDIIKKEADRLVLEE